MRKKICLIVFCLMIFFAVPACGNEAGTSRAAAGQSKGVSDVLEAGIAGADAETESADITDPEPKAAAAGAINTSS